MGHIKLEIPVKGIHQALVPGQCFKGNGVDKVCGVLRHQHMDIRMKFHQTACQ